MSFLRKLGAVAVLTGMAIGPALSAACPTPNAPNDCSMYKTAAGLQACLARVNLLQQPSSTPLPAPPDPANPSDGSVEVIYKEACTNLMDGNAVPTAGVPQYYTTVCLQLTLKNDTYQNLIGVFLTPQKGLIQSPDALKLSMTVSDANSAAKAIALSKTVGAKNFSAARITLKPANGDSETPWVLRIPFDHSYVSFIKDNQTFAKTMLGPGVRPFEELQEVLANACDYAP